VTFFAPSWVPPATIQVSLRHVGRFDREAALAEYQRWLPLINFENRQCGLLAAKALMKEGGVIGCEAPRHPLPAMHPDTRAGLIETARRLDPMVLHWGA
jgi:2-keto-3-deoxy-L-arabinonate dehydratase